MTPNTQYFQDWLKEKLSYNDYENLHNSLGYSKKKTTMVLSNIEEMSKEDIKKICEIVGCQANDLIDQFNAGYYTLTKPETQELRELIIIPAGAGLEGNVKPKARRNISKTVNNVKP